LELGGSRRNRDAVTHGDKVTPGSPIVAEVLESLGFEESLGFLDGSLERDVVGMS
jgi:hypothetical protein